MSGGRSEFDHWLTLIGKNVRVTMDHDDPHAVSVGVLVGLAEDGQGTVIEEDGVRHYIWPVLNVEEIR